MLDLSGCFAVYLSSRCAKPVGKVENISFIDERSMIK